VGSKTHKIEIYFGENKKGIKYQNQINFYKIEKKIDLISTNINYCINIKSKMSANTETKIKAPKKKSAKEELVETKSLLDVFKGKYSGEHRTACNLSNILHKKEDEIRCDKARQIHTLGRLAKYEGAEILDEMFAYAIKSGMFVKCNSEVVGVKTRVARYFPKHKVKVEQYAHYTNYDNYLQRAETADEAPIYYEGNFLIKSYEPILRERLMAVKAEWSPFQEIKNVNDLLGLSLREPAPKKQAPAPEAVAVAVAVAPEPKPKAPRKPRQPKAKKELIIEE
jgi:hypothetical protein